MSSSTWRRRNYAASAATISVTRGCASGGHSRAAPTRRRSATISDDLAEGRGGPPRRSARRNRGQWRNRGVSPPTESPGLARPVFARSTAAFSPVCWATSPIHEENGGYKATHDRGCVVSVGAVPKGPGKRGGDAVNGRAEYGAPVDQTGSVKPRDLSRTCARLTAMGLELGAHLVRVRTASRFGTSGPGDGEAAHRVRTRPEPGGELRQINRARHEILSARARERHGRVSARFHHPQSCGARETRTSSRGRGTAAT